MIEETKDEARLNIVCLSLTIRNGHVFRAHSRRGGKSGAAINSLPPTCPGFRLARAIGSFDASCFGTQVYYDSAKNYYVGALRVLNVWLNSSKEISKGDRSLLGRLDEAKVEMHRALELDPLSSIIMADIGQLHYFAHERDAAIEYCKRALALDGDFLVAHEYLVDIYRSKGMEPEAFDEWLWVKYAGKQPNERSKEIFARSGFQPSKLPSRSVKPVKSRWQSLVSSQLLQTHRRHFVLWRLHVTIAVRAGEAIQKDCRGVEGREQLAGFYR
jgi:tetratricopeptide (TPR) repeat protein